MFSYPCYRFFLFFLCCFLYCLPFIGELNFWSGSCFLKPHCSSSSYSLCNNRMRSATVTWRVVLCDRSGARWIWLDNNRDWSENSWVAWRWWFHQPARCHTQHFGTSVVPVYWRFHHSEHICIVLSVLRANQRIMWYFIQFFLRKRCMLDRPMVHQQQSSCWFVTFCELYYAAVNLHLHSIVNWKQNCLPGHIISKLVSK